MKTIQYPNGIQQFIICFLLYQQKFYQLSSNLHKDIIHNQVPLCFFMIQKFHNYLYIIQTTNQLITSTNPTILPNE